MSRRKGQNPKVRIGKRADGQQYYFSQYWVDVPGHEERRRQTEVIGLVSQLPRSKAARKELDFISRLQLNSNEYQIPSSYCFADARSAIGTIRQQMGHSSHHMTAVYSGEIPLDQVRAAFSRKLLEKIEN